MTLNSKLSILFMAIFGLGLAACSPSGGGGGGGAATVTGLDPAPAGPAVPKDPDAPHDTHEEPQDDGKVKLRFGANQKVIIDSASDLRHYVKNFEFAKFEITKNASFVRWESIDEPIIRFIRKGVIEVTVSDVRDGRKMKLNFNVVFDTSGIPPDVLPGEPLPLDPPIPL